jgi:hypothetical protein
MGKGTYFLENLMTSGCILLYGYDDDVLFKYWEKQVPLL